MLLFDSLSQEKQKLIIKNNTINMYVCGPTVYDYLHLGNFRGAILFNALRNFLESLGYTVNFAYNYTDVDDKIIEKAKELNWPALKVSDHFINEFKKDYINLKLKPHTINPKVSDYIPQMVSYIQEIINQGNAYEVQGSVYIKRHNFDQVGLLSKRDINQGLSSEKNDLEGKLHPSDFALWKAAKEGEISWPSPWGNGRPGWHIECSVMIYEIFKGQELDIHGGGLDLLFPHHENECYQCLAHGQKSLSKLWIHNQMLNFDGKKMSKSLGNVLTGREFIEKHSGELLKFIMLSHHYRSIIDFGPKSVDSARNKLARIYYTMKKAQGKGSLTHGFNSLKEKVNQALEDDFNTPVVMGYIYEAMNEFYKNEKEGENFLFFMKSLGEVLSLFQEDPEKYMNYLDNQDLEKIGLTSLEIENLILQRQNHRKNKDYKKSDDVRRELVEKGINLLDTKSGTSWEVIRKDEKD